MRPWTLFGDLDIEMSKAISKLFEEAKDTCVIWEGEPLYGLYEMAAPQKFVVTILRSRASPVQGLTLKSYGGSLRINDVESPEMLIWADTAPARMTVCFKPSEGRRAKLKIWNTWRGKVGGVDVTQAWLGNAGMRVERSGSDLYFHCSDGEGPVDFKDLEVQITVLG